MLPRFLRHRWQDAAANPGAAAGQSPVRPSPTAETPGATPVPSLASATRDYARALEADTFDRLDSHEVTRLFLGMGPEVWAWQRARRLAGVSPWRASPAFIESGERENAFGQMLRDIPLWERAIATLAAERTRAARYGMPEPAPLIVPPAVTAAIEAQKVAARERALRLRGRGGGDGGGGGPELVPVEPGGGGPGPPRRT
ncbi:hypothetical protein A3862_20890 [Methylobacterium sp. XJLW]|uniref:hypothetical protein n=1 Tax=Methylobacterium sp. XJLW TaxID=739141 RepID=UPI000DAADBFB|nr:hypothetical protein [Methylobacterium sp. XJLW]AWV17654.1 hypothetical protein A3862_20890 [Methylobacterium sp. XJLW]